MSNKLSELEPCRWCKGTKAKVLDFAESAIHVACPCGVQMFGGRAHFGSRDEAIAAWNRRASPAPAIPMPPLNDAMRAVLTNENCIYGTPDELYAALVKAAPAIPACVGCEGKPAAGNDPCAVCGKSGAAPIPMLLFCPQCGTQHIDAPENEPGQLISGGPNAGRAVSPKVTWSNPPHRSHLCHACSCIWRPADVATVGVDAIETRGKADTWNGVPAISESEDTERLEWLMHRLSGKALRDIGVVTSSGGIEWAREAIDAARDGGGS
ncbi:hypothetical protein [Burkholderia gladioli]|uniref:hypothetical protein n=1 Tax=Burkholderia gladioli TaxID=28095 RepID=UPI0016415470|nr:hypothetical protein [Burkholderia gladioli]